MIHKSAAAIKAVSNMFYSSPVVDGTWYLVPFFGVTSLEFLSNVSRYWVNLNHYLHDTDSQSAHPPSFHKVAVLKTMSWTTDESVGSSMTGLKSKGYYCSSVTRKLIWQKFHLKPLWLSAKNPACNHCLKKKWKIVESKVRCVKLSWAPLAAEDQLK